MEAERDKTSLGHEGYALLTVMVFVVALILAVTAFFALSSYETGNSLYRQDSSEAFYLADGAVERVRAKFLEDHTWRDGWSNVASGRGAYDLAVRDTTFMGLSNVVQLVGTGRVQLANRRVEVMARIQPTAYGLPLLIMQNADVNGNLCLDAAAHVNGSADFGPHDSHLACGSEYTEGFPITPPPIHTDPAHFPNATYYYVRGARIGGVYQARIFNAAGFDITSALGDSLTDITTFDTATGTFEYTFDDDLQINRYFDEVTGVFQRAPGDVAVVVNFGEPPLLNPPGINGIAALEFDAGISTTIHATIVNTRFTGVLESQRSDFNYWTGGLTTVKQIVFEPHYGLGLIVHDFMKQGGSLVQLGSETLPALNWVTRDVVNINSNLELTGSLICLGNWTSQGGPDIHYDPSFIENLPPYLVEEFSPGVSGTMDILRWRELASLGP